MVVDVMVAADFVVAAADFMPSDVAAAEAVAAEAVAAEAAVAAVAAAFLSAAVVAVVSEAAAYRGASAVFADPRRDEDWLQGGANEMEIEDGVIRVLRR